MQNANQEVHLWPVVLGAERRVSGVAPSALRLPLGPTVLTDALLADITSVAPRFSTPASGVLVEPFFNQRKQLRLLARFPEATAPQVNGESAARTVVLTPGDCLQWEGGRGFRVMLFNKPQIGPPPASVHGKPCPVCQVPFTATASCVTCVCGVVLHCEPDEKEGLQCAQMRRDCPVCKRPTVLSEGYVNPPANED